jgi:lysophospholipid acyltransferase
MKSHIEHQLLTTALSRMDHTAPMMVLVMKLTSFAWSCHDGTKQDKDLSSGYQKHFKIVQMPGLLEFFGFVFFFPCFLIGPSFQFKDYHDFIHSNVRIHF